MTGRFVCHRCKRHCVFATTQQHSDAAQRHNGTMTRQRGAERQQSPMSEVGRLCRCPLATGNRVISISAARVCAWCACPSPAASCSPTLVLCVVAGDVPFVPLKPPHTRCHEQLRWIRSASDRVLPRGSLVPSWSVSSLACSDLRPRYRRGGQPHRRQPIHHCAYHFFTAAVALTNPPLPRARIPGSPLLLPHLYPRTTQSTRSRL